MKIWQLCLLYTIRNNRMSLYDGLSCDLGDIKILFANIKFNDLTMGQSRLNIISVRYTLNMNGCVNHKWVEK